MEIPSRPFRKALMIVLMLCVNEPLSAGEIAFTFDDAPNGDSAIMSGDKRTKRLIKALKKSSIQDALFYVNTGKINDANKHRLQRYTRAGYHLGNHSHSHLSASKMPENEYMRDVYHAHLILKSYDNVLPFHRFPYLHYGEDAKAIDNLQAHLDELGYKNGYVTVDNFDWYINNLLNNAKRQGKTINYKKAERIYVDTIWQTISFYDSIAQKALGRSPKHVLLLHENDTSALFIEKLAAHIRQKGWKIISPQEAYSDPIATAFTKNSFHSQGRVAALAYDRGMAAKDLRHDSEDEGYLDELFENAGVFE